MRVSMFGQKLGVSNSRSSSNCYAIPILESVGCFMFATLAMP